MIIQAQRTFFTRQGLQQLTRFLSVGVICTLVDLVAFLLIRGLLGLPTLPANILSYSLGIVVSFWLNRSWTFAATAHQAVGRQFVRFLLVSLSALVLNTGVVLGLETLLANMHGLSQADYLLAKAVATVIGVFWNFCANRYWTFREGVFL